MLTTIARLLSFLLNPIFILIPVPYLLVYRQTYDVIYSLKWSIISVIFLGATGLFMLFAVWRGVFSDLDVSKRKQRPLLFFVVFIITFSYLLLIKYVNGPQILFISITGVLMGILFISVVNEKIKASLHMATITSVILTIGIIYEVHVVTFLLVPILAWARVRAKRHSLQETLVGITAGAFVTLVMYISMRYLLHLSI